MSRDSLKDTKDEEDKQLYKGAFDDFDWNKNGTIPTRVRNYFLFALMVYSFHFVYCCVGFTICNEESWTESDRC